MDNLTVVFNNLGDEGNEAFQPDARPEVARILRELAGRIEDGAESGKLFDINGNVCGHFDINE